MDRARLVLQCSIFADACDETLCRHSSPAKGHQATARLQDIDIDLPQIP